MNIDDLVITEKREGKFIYLHLNSEKAALLIGKAWSNIKCTRKFTQLVA